VIQYLPVNKYLNQDKKRKKRTKQIKISQAIGLGFQVYFLKII